MAKFRLTFLGRGSDGEHAIDQAVDSYTFWVEAGSLEEARDITQACLGIQVYSDEVLSAVVSVTPADESQAKSCPGLISCLSNGQAEITFCRNNEGRITKIQKRPFTVEDMLSKTLLRMRIVLNIPEEATS